MPVEHLAAALRVPVPFGFTPERIDAVPQLALLRVLAVEVLTGAQQARDEKGGFDKVAAVVLPGEGDRPAGLAVEKMRKNAVIAVRPVEEADHLQQAIERLLPADPVALDRHEDGHDAEPGAAGRDDLGAVAERLIAAFPRQPAGRVREIPEVPEGLPLHEVEQGFVAELGRADGA